jgi:hypothetical protein
MKKIKKETFTLKELLSWEQFIAYQIYKMETVVPKESKGQEYDYIEQVKASEEYKGLIALKEKLDNIRVELNFGKPKKYFEKRLGRK